QPADSTRRHDYLPLPHHRANGPSRGAAARRGTNTHAAPDPAPGRQPCAPGNGPTLVVEPDAGGHKSKYALNAHGGARFRRAEGGPSEGGLYRAGPAPRIVAYADHNFERYPGAGDCAVWWV